MTLLDETEPTLPAEMPLRLSGQQSALLGALINLDQSLATMYQGTLEVLQSQNVNRFALAAHGHRELIEKLPHHFGVGNKAHSEQLKSELHNLEGTWISAKNKGRCFADEKWTGEIDKKLRKFLLKADDFFAKHRANNPKRREEVANLIDHLDPSRERLPKALEELNVEIIQNMRRYFNSVAHHGHDPDPDNFTQWCDEFERFLLDRLIPRTFDDMDGIDEIIEEGQRCD